VLVWNIQAKPRKQQPGWNQNGNLLNPILGPYRFDILLGPASAWHHCGFAKWLTSKGKKSRGMRQTLYQEGTLNDELFSSHFLHLYGMSFTAVWVSMWHIHYSKFTLGFGIIFL
jgi:hypothetical protein